MQGGGQLNSMEELDEGQQEALDTDEKVAAFVEMLLFLESEPMPLQKIASIGSFSEERAESAIEILKEKYSSALSGIELSFVAGGFMLSPRKRFWNLVKNRYGRKNDGKLSRSALETLTIIAYKQPITRAEIEGIRGVPPDSMIRLLVERQLIKEVGKKDAPGRPTLFGTTAEFLRFFQLNSISDLPKLDEKDEERFVLAR